MGGRVYNFAIIPGDGTGPEVVAQGLKVIKAASEKFAFQYKTKEFDFSGGRYLKTGKLVEDADIEELKKYDAIYLGAVGDPQVKPGIIETGVLLKLRFALDQYVNLRPVKLYNSDYCPLKDKKPADIDFVVVRENSEGLYKGMGEFKDKGTKDEVAIQISYNTRKGVERCIRYAFEYTRKRNKAKKLTLCGKTNVLTFAWNLWERTFNEVAKDYPDITTDYAHVDATTMWFVKNPEWFDVIVTDNMFGDIITKYTGKNVISPLAAICAAGMMLENAGEIKAAQAVEAAVIKVASSKLKSLAAGKMGYSTSEVGDLVADNL